MDGILCPRAVYQPQASKERLPIMSNRRLLTVPQTSFSAFMQLLQKMFSKHHFKCKCIFEITLDKHHKDIPLLIFFACNNHVLERKKLEQEEREMLKTIFNASEHTNKRISSFRAIFGSSSKYLRNTLGGILLNA